MAYDRSDRILKYIVEYFIKHASPVGSQTLIEEYNLPYSSATIRNEMAILERLGYIEKPHLSAGRVPSTKGYEYYCEHLRNRDMNIDEELKYSLQTILDKKIQSVEEIIKASCEILSHMTSLATVVIGPSEEERLANVQLIKISDKTLTAIFVTNKGYVENKTFVVDESINTNEVVECMKILNDRLQGTLITELPAKMQALKPIISDYVIEHNLVYQALIESFLKFASDRMSFYGREQLFNNPEFKNDTEKLEKVFNLMNNMSVFKDISNEVKNEPAKTVVHIGDVGNNPDVATVTAKIKLGEGRETSITLLGPTRMDYDKVLSSLEYLSDELEKYFDTKEED